MRKRWKLWRRRVVGEDYFNTKHGRMNVLHRLSVSGRTIVVSYEDLGEQIVVVNALREKG